MITTTLVQNRMQIDKRWFTVFVLMKKEKVAVQKYMIAVTT